MLRDGECVGVDEKSATECFRIAAENGNTEGMFLYGEMLEKSESKDDVKEAAKCYKLAADKGNKNAMLKYSSMLKNGKGVEMNEEESQRYSDMASQFNEPEIGIECSIC